MAYFISCPHCACPVRSSDAACPHCDAVLRTTGGKPQALTTAAIVLGLTAAVAATACEGAPEYGVPAGGSEPVGGADIGGAGGGAVAGAPEGGAGGQAIGGAGGEAIGGAGGQGGGAAPLYGIAGTGGDGGGKL